MRAYHVRPWCWRAPCAVGCWQIRSQDVVQPGAPGSEGGGLFCVQAVSHTKQDKWSPWEGQMGPVLVFLLTNGRVWPGFYSFLVLGPWEKKERCHKVGSREAPRVGAHAGVQGCFHTDQSFWCLSYKSCYEVIFGLSVSVGKPCIYPI